jgi:hypothetical protein
MKMRKKKKIIVVYMAMGLTLIGCNNAYNNDVETEVVVTETTEQEDENNMEETKLMTREYLLEHGFATEEDLDQVDVERMIAECDWHEGDEETYNIALLFSDLKRDFLLDEYVIDYSYLLETDKSEEPFTEEDIEQLKVVAYVYNSGTTNVSMVFDFSERKAYVDDDGRLLERIPCPEDYIELSDEQIAEVKKIIQDCKVPEWKKKYKGRYDSSISDWGWWYMCYELEDGRIYSNSGGGICDELPEKLMDLQNGLEDFFDSIK